MSAPPTLLPTEIRPLSSVDSRDTLNVATHTPLPIENEMLQPRPPFLLAASNSFDGSARNSEIYNQSIPASEGDLLSKQEPLSQESATEPHSTPKRKRRPLLIVLVAAVVLAVLAVAIVVPVYFTVIKAKPRGASVSGASTASGPQPTAGPSGGPTTKEGIFGGDGSTVKTDNGSTFTYNNKFGGIWYHDPDDPYNNNAYPNSWTPPLNKSWNFNTDRIFGVNLGGWFVLEPFITPALFQRYPAATDEWSFSTLMRADTANGGISQLEEHYKTFITEDDFAEIAGAGMNWVRIPIPHWAIDVWNDEPFLARTSWKYIVQALQWCRKYGLRVKIDLHTAPGSQNGYNHSGLMGQINFLRGTMGIANAQRFLNYIRIFTEFFSQPEWKDVVIMFGIINEPLVGTIGDDQLQSFNYQAYKVIRNITGIGEGNGLYVSYHNMFLPMTHWPEGFMTGADRIVTDGHPYMAFDPNPSTDPIDTGTGPGAGGIWPARPCERWAADFNGTRTAYGVTIAGEWSNAINDCGLFVRGTQMTSTFAGGCEQWTDSRNWTEGTKAGLMRLAMTTMDTSRDWFFWTWKVNPSQRGIVEAPLWSYQLGLREGWMPTDPRTAIGACGASIGPTWSGQFESWMTGGVGAGQLRTDRPWPPASISNAPSPATDLPVYTSTGSISTLPVPTYTDSAGKPIVSGSGWFNAQDNIPAPTPIPGCAYPNPWDAQNVAVPAGCTGTV